ncbi:MULTISPECIES: hypothetical protein [Pseudobacillus]|uniref:hypothetical protein n=1 Tax=Pseudobacillus TaxID=108525 RepID=UPI00387924B9
MKPPKLDLFFKRVSDILKSLFSSKDKEDPASSNSENSTPIKSKREEHLLREYRQVLDFLQEQNEAYTSIQLIKGGHDNERTFQVILDNNYLYEFIFVDGNLQRVQKKLNDD